MPYIKKENRKRFEKTLYELYYSGDTLNKGELNYLFTMICSRYLNINKESYSTYNDIIGALESCKLEWYRRKVVPYEEKKIKENGDV